MAIQYKPTKQKKEKPAKAPKAPKPEKQIKIGAATKVKATKPAKAPKAPKAPKAEKVKAFTPTFKGGKVKKSEEFEKTSVLKKTINPLVFAAVAVVLVVVAVLALTVFIPAVEEKGQEIKDITIASTPNKTVYFIGEEANYDGLRVTVTRKNGETFTVRANQCDIKGFDSSKPEQMIITVTYEGFTTDFSIKVEEPPRQVPVLVGIHLDPLPKTEYKLGEHLYTLDGVIIREYADGTTAKAMLLYTHVYGFDSITEPGTYTLTVRYKENGKLAETTSTITVTE